MVISFIVYDIIFMIIFTIAVFVFLRTRKKNLQKQGWMYLYRTKLGLKLIDTIAEKYAGILRPLQYAIISLGYLLMAGMLWILVYSTYLYIKYPIISQTIKAPPVIPLIPYFPQLFSLQSIFPPFYFTYFLVALIIVAVSHEFSHGIIAKLNKIKIHSIGFAFLGPILGAFVEQDEKQMNRAPKFSQLAVLGAGVFANILMAIIFLALIWLLFISSFAPAGLIFSDYAAGVISKDSIQTVQNTSLDNFMNLSFPQNSDFAEIQANNKTYLADPLLIQKFLKSNENYFLVYQDAPAIRAKLVGPIISIDEKKITSPLELSQVLSLNKPGDVAIITTKKGNEVKRYSINLSSSETGKAFLGISIGQRKQNSLLSIFYNLTPKINDIYSGVYYESKIGKSGTFIFYMLWWIMAINFFVALFNMLPLGILDGGRFFMLTIIGITKKEKIGKIAFKGATWLIVILLILMVARWLFNFF